MTAPTDDCASGCIWEPRAIASFKLTDAGRVEVCPGEDGGQ